MRRSGGCGRSTLKQREFQFRQMASALVHGGVPMEEITTLNQPSSGRTSTRSAEFFIGAAPGGGPPNGQLIDLLRILRPIALSNDIKDRSRPSGSAGG